MGVYARRCGITEAFILGGTKFPFNGIFCDCCGNVDWGSNSVIRMMIVMISEDGGYVEGNYGSHREER